MKANSERCRLLKLPAEIRNLIYGLVLVQDEAINLHKVLKRQERPCDLISAWRHTVKGIYHNLQAMVKQPPLTKTCQQIRNEALPIFYGANTFATCIINDRGGRQYVDASRWSTRWLTMVGKHNRKLLKQLHIPRPGNFECLMRFLKKFPNEASVRFIQTLGGSKEDNHIGEEDESDSDVGSVGSLDPESEASLMKGGGLHLTFKDSEDS